MTTKQTWHRITQRDWWAKGIDSHDESDCPGDCPGEVITPGHDRYDLHDTWLANERKRRRLTPDDRAAALTKLRAEAASIESAISHEVYEARMAGVSWSIIGNGLGMTRQAAQQRYGRIYGI